MNVINTAVIEWRRQHRPPHRHVTVRRRHYRVRHQRRPIVRRQQPPPAQQQQQQPQHLPQLYEIIPIHHMMSEQRHRR